MKARCRIHSPAARRDGPSAASHCLRRSLLHRCRPERAAAGAVAIRRDDHPDNAADRWQRLVAARVLGPVITPLPHGRLPATTAHLCIDMQNLFADATPWQTPWMAHTRPVTERLARYRPAPNIFTRFIPPLRPEDMTGAWRRYFDRWRELTGALVDPHLLELVPELKELAPAGTVLDKTVYSAFHDGCLAPALHRQGIDTLVVSGTETDVCVLATVLAAVDHGFRVVVAVDALCSSADPTHDALMQVYHDRFGQQIEPARVGTILAQWGS